MKINFNKHGNGACPSCRKINTCLIRLKLSESLQDIKDPNHNELDIVVYLCPSYEE